MRMNYSKEQRQRIVAELIRSDLVSSQEELAERLAAKGYCVTQATISRDLEQIGAVKLRRAGHLSYALPEQMRGSTGPRLEAVLAQWVQSIDVAMNMVVIKTPPGSAHLIGVAIDESDVAAAVGTICGDDTVFVACRSLADAEDLAREFRSSSGILD